MGVVRELSQFDYEAFSACMKELGHSFTQEEFIKVHWDIHFNNNKFTYVYEVDDEVVATASVFYERKFGHQGQLVAHVEDVAVREDKQGLGYGATLVRFIRDQAKQKQAYKVLLYCSEKNVAFYRMTGFERSEVLMRLNLDDS